MIYHYLFILLFFFFFVTVLLLRLSSKQSTDEKKKKKKSSKIRENAGTITIAGVNRERRQRRMSRRPLLTPAEKPSPERRQKVSLPASTEDAGASFSAGVLC
jgi:Flp pilus assembly protein TadB